MLCCLRALFKEYFKLTLLVSILSDSIWRLRRHFAVAGGKTDAKSVETFNAFNHGLLHRLSVVEMTFQNDGSKTYPTTLIQANNPNQVHSISKHWELASPLLCYLQKTMRVFVNTAWRYIPHVLSRVPCLLAEESLSFHHFAGLCISTQRTQSSEGHPSGRELRVCMTGKHQEHCFVGRLTKASIVLCAGYNEWWDKAAYRLRNVKGKRISIKVKYAANQFLWKLAQTWR